MEHELALISTHSAAEYAQKVRDALCAIYPIRAKHDSKPIEQPDLISTGFKFHADGEIYHEFPRSVRDKDVFIIAPLRTPRRYPKEPDHGLHRNLAELLFLIDQVADSPAYSIHVVLPYFPYARSERKDRPGVDIKAATLVKLLTTSLEGRRDSVITAEMHAPAIQGIFKPSGVKCDHVSYTAVWMYLVRHLPGYAADHHSISIVSPDDGGSKRNRDDLEKKNRFKANYINMEKGPRPAHGELNPAHLAVGQQTITETAIVLDDMVDGGGTSDQAARKLLELGSKNVFIATAHAVLSGQAVPRLQKLYNEFGVPTIATDGIWHPDYPFLTQLPTAWFWAEVIYYVHTRQSVSTLLGSLPRRRQINPLDPHFLRNPIEFLGPNALSRKPLR